jgi:Zn-dependent peptidase ImmA (M78 family)/DNA-binding XRE family transcriptional regulator
VLTTSIGERIKQGRQIRGYSQRELANAAGVSAQAISKYERDRDVPGSGVLIRLSRALDVGVEFFVRPSRISRISPSFRKHCSLSRKAEGAVIANIRDWLEKYLEIENILFPDEKDFAFKYPAGFPRLVQSFADVEAAVVDLRDAWDLGLDCIENLTSLLEDRGIKVGIVDADDDFDACTFDAEDDRSIMVIAVRSGIPGDRQRFSLAHELGHLMLETKDGLDPEKAANRFAGAFLVPNAAVKFELRNIRKTIGDYELHMLKDKYGLSMQAWVFRARDLGFISEERALALFKRFRANGWHMKEPGEPYFPERPIRFTRLVMGALVEGIISENRASELLGKPLQLFLSEVKEEHGGLLAAVCN